MSYEDQLIRESTGEGLPSWFEVHEDYEPNPDESETNVEKFDREIGLDQESAESWRKRWEAEQLDKAK